MLRIFSSFGFFILLNSSLVFGGTLEDLQKMIAVQQAKIAQLSSIVETLKNTPKTPVQLICEDVINTFRKSVPNTPNGGQVVGIEASCASTKLPTIVVGGSCYSPSGDALAPTQTYMDLKQNHWQCDFVPKDNIDRRYNATATCCRITN